MQELDWKVVDSSAEFLELSSDLADAGSLDDAGQQRGRKRRSSGPVSSTNQPLWH